MPNWNIFGVQQANDDARRNGTEPIGDADAGGTGDKGQGWGFGDSNPYGGGQDLPQWVPGLTTGRPGNVWTEGEGGILGNQARQIAGSNPLLDQAAVHVQGLAGMSPEYQAAFDEMKALDTLSGMTATGANVENDPAFQAAMEAFETARLPMIENQAALSGLGRSTALGNAAAVQQAHTLMPAIQDSIARETDRINRQLTQGNQNVANLLKAGDARHAKSLDAIGALSQLGDYGRGVEQERSDAEYNDFMRRAALFEQSMNGPAGLLPSTIGSETSQNKKM